MGTVDKIILNLLAARKSVDIPGVGTLKIVAHPARKGADGTMTAPHNELVCGTADKKSVGLMAAIAETGGVGKPQAEQLFEEWMTTAKTDDGVRIEGVGVVSAQGVVIDPALDARLNPVAPERNARFNWRWVWIILLVVFVIGAWWTYTYWDNIKPRLLGSCCTSEAVATQAQDTTAQSPSLAELEPIGAQSPEGAQNGYHVIVGVFDVRANADRMISYMAEEGYTSTYKFIPGRARFYVTAGRFDNEEDAIRLKHQIDEVIPDVWIYAYRIGK